MIRHHLKIHSLIFTFVCFLVAFMFLSHPQIGLAIENAGKAGGLLSLFIAGAAYTTSITTPAATAAIFYLGKVFNPILIAAIGAFGALCTDYLIFRLIRKRFGQSAHYFAEKLKLKSKFKKELNFFAPILAAFIIASPLPDELGVAGLSATNVKRNMFFIYSYVGNFVGILIISHLGSIL